MDQFELRGKIVAVMSHVQDPVIVSLRFHLGSEGLSNGSIAGASELNYDSFRLLEYFIMVPSQSLRFPESYIMVPEYFITVPSRLQRSSVRVTSSFYYSWSVMSSP